MSAAAFDRELEEAYREAKKECHYNGARFWQLFRQYGGVETARRLLSRKSGGLKALTALFLNHRLDLSIEAKVLIPQYRPLFPAELRRTARRRLEEFGFDVDAWIQNQNPHPHTKSPKRPAY